MGGLLIFAVAAIISLIFLYKFEKQERKREKGYAKRNFKYHPKERINIFILNKDKEVLFYTIDDNGRKVFYELPAFDFSEKGNWLVQGEWITVQKGFDSYIFKAD